MLTIQPLSKAQDAFGYYTEGDNYYLADKDGLEQGSLWMGKGAEKLGLSGEVKSEDFLPLLEGRLPSGQVLGIQIGDDRKHRAGTDVTLSAPKSVSLMALVGKDKRLIEAHQKAVSAVVERLEKMAAEARLTIKGEVLFEKTNNLTIASFQHSTSRELDPNLHTHLVILNMTERLDGMWRALSSKSRADREHFYNGFREILYDNQHLFGLIYTSTLAKEVRAFGFDIEIKDKYGNFEIKGLSQSYIEASSKQRNRIKERLSSLGLNSSKAAEVANLDTRAAKKSIDSDSLEKLWDDEAKTHQVDFKSLQENAAARKEQGQTQPFQPEPLCAYAEMAVDDAIAHLSRFNARIKHADIVRIAFDFGRTHLESDALEAVIEEKLKNGHLKGRLYQDYTSEALLKREQQFVKSMTGNANEGLSIDVRQSSAAARILKSSAQVQIVDVKHQGAEKKLLTELVNQADSQGLSAFILHQSAFEARLLQKDIKRDTSTFIKWFKALFKEEIAFTVNGFQYAYERILEQNIFTKKRNDIIVVHDAQKLSFDDIEALKEKALKSQSKLVLVNALESTDGAAPGSPIKALKDAGVVSHEVSQLSKDIPVNLCQSKAPLDAVINSWLKKAPNARENTLIYAATRKEQAELTEKLREKLKSKGEISIQEKSIDTLSTLTLSEPQKKHLKFYQIGDALVFHAFSSKEKRYYVIGKQKDSLTLVNEKGRQSSITLDKTQDAVVFKKSTLNISIGDKLMLEKKCTVRGTDFEKNSEFEVAGLSEKDITIKTGNKTLKIDNKTIQKGFFSHALVKRASQISRHYDEALIGTKSWQLSGQNLKELSSKAKNICWMTDDLNQAKQILNREKTQWSIEDIAQFKDKTVKREMRFAPEALTKDLEYLAKSLSENTQKNATDIAQEAVAFALSKCAEREAAFSHKQMITDALMHSLGKASFDDISKILAERLKAGELSYLNTWWITKEAYELEKSILEINKAEQGAVTPVITDKNELLNINPQLTQGQKDAIFLALTNKDRFVSIQGFAGTGKTTMMKEVQKFSNAKGIEVFGLTPTHKARMELEASQIKTQTVESFLTGEYVFPEKTLCIVDETSMIDSKRYHELQNRALHQNVTLIFAGDITQLQSITAGVPHELTVKTGTQKTAFMKDIVRQKTPDLKEAAYHATAREIRKSFEKTASINPNDHVQRKEALTEEYNSSVIEIKPDLDKETGKTDFSPLYDAVAKDYLSRTHEHRERTLVIAHVNKDREAIDTRIREGLQQEGIIDKENHTATRYISRDMTKAELMLANNYKPGDIINFDNTWSVAKRGDYFKIKEVNLDKNQLTCLCDDKTFKINPAKMAGKARMSIFEEQNCQLSKGDRIRIKRSDKVRNRTANTEYEVSSVKGSQINLKNDKESITLNINDHKDRHWDYAYTHTAYSIQGGTDRHVISLSLNARKQATTHRSHEIDITRASHQATIYTESKEEVIDRLENPKFQFESDKKSAWLMKQAFTERQDKEKALRQTLAVEKTVKEGGAVSQIESNKENDRDSDTSLSFKGFSEKPVSHEPSAKDIESMLKSSLPALALALLGEHNAHRSTKTNLRYGSKGSLSIDLVKGMWNNFETDESGNCFELIKTQMGFTDFKDVIGYAKDFLNCRPIEMAPVVSKELQSEKINDDENKKKEIIEKIVKNSVPVKGTIAETYLRKIRGLNHFEQADIRFVRSCLTYHQDKKTFVPALVSIARNNKGGVNNIELIKLNPETGDKDYASDPIKQGLGARKGTYVELNKHHKSDKVYVSEGVETGLSILECDKNARVVTVLGKSNFRKLKLSGLQKNIVFCVDNDGADTFKTQLIIDAIDRAESAGFNVSVVMPDMLKNKNKTDLNDVLLHAGKDGLNQVLRYELTADKYRKIHSESLALSSNKMNKINNKSITDTDEITLDLLRKTDRAIQNFEPAKDLISKEIQQIKQLERNQLELEREL
ncbi:conjugative transfer relaxase/helicase TraI (plasmid) [Legionella israelensis]|uniref:conjugative transfer relaxase/helicase TraI n=1 Tax=Legionella israelensis TaxID=454 RepID=UPI00117DA5D3|nr:conjugative transfer relaxase/helicase TraI [Legionella israelensis]QDP73733.1 conjugative transfer relaxase/helicase TraI [Legionella israelensis]